MHIPHGGGPDGGDHNHRGPDAATVIAAQAGDAQALDRLVSAYLPLIYNIVGRALNGHADTDDVVQETMLRAVRGLPGLRAPAAFRSWLVAVAIHQMRDHFRARQATPADLSDEVPDPGADFVDLTILRLGLSDQREETAQATRWLDPDDRELLALWWLEAGGELDRSEVTAALGLPPSHVAVRVARMKEQLTIARVVVRALRADPPCAGLAPAVAGWDGVPSPLWRKRLARHLRDCPRCGACQRGLIPAERLLAGLTLVPVPLAAAARDAASLPGPASPRSPGHGHRPARRPATRARHGHVLAKAGSSLPLKLTAVAVAACCVAAGAVAVVHLSRARPVAAAAPAATPTTAGAASTPQVLTQPSARPSPTPRAHRHHRRAAPPPAPPAAPAAVASAKKGVGAWSFSGATQALAESGASWYYTWSATPGVTGPAGLQFVPMIWGSADVTASTLSQVKQEGPDLLGFNEPDMASQSNMTPAQALGLWPQLMATGMQLGSPAVADGGATPGGWLDQFMSGARARGYRVNFITLHWYGADFDTAAAVSQLQSYLEAVYARYHLPIWLTEFALANFGGSPQTPTPQQQAAFVTAATGMLQGLSFVPRYAWFGLQATSTDGSMGLFNAGPVATATGRAFEAAG
ncbi:MAG TPA: sigma-70 family RNA polymerase sigma factor [Streptosporangiaceae bacterium]|jgi:RNA polymerase sigma factor (sigma-70 family)|nr:sigma-70 family RNA polymerase sigma factor [Streptosporangiaceae bacterium]